MNTKNHDVTAKSDSEDLRFYIDGILHIRIPRDKNTQLQSWIDGHKKKFTIEVSAKNRTERYEYDNKELWVKMLDLFDKHL